MQTFTASFLGRDSTGVVAAVTRLLFEADCSVMAVSQTILSGDFAAIFMVQAPDSLAPDNLHAHLVTGLERANVDLSVIVRPAVTGSVAATVKCEPFVVTASGPDGHGLLAALSQVFGRHKVNIESLRALLDEEHDSEHALSIFEVMVPEGVDLGRLGRELRHEAQRLGWTVSIQHRDIFEAMHRIGTF